MIEGKYAIVKLIQACMRVTDLFVEDKEDK